jgi:hypothetical protein
MPLLIIIFIIDYCHIAIFSPDTLFIFADYCFRYFRLPLLFSMPFRRRFDFRRLRRHYADTLMLRLSPIRHYYCQIFRQLMPAAPMPCCFAALIRPADTPPFTPLPLFRCQRRHAIAMPLFSFAIRRIAAAIFAAAAIAFAS